MFRQISLVAKLSLDLSLICFCAHNCFRVYSIGDVHWQISDYNGW